MGTINKRVRGSGSVSVSNKDWSSSRGIFFPWRKIPKIVMHTSYLNEKMKRLQ